jgi:molybdopterin-guanine dinucleotide biosynthesis protein A
MPSVIPAAALMGLVLAGGRGQRMGGADKGLQLLHGRPLAAHVLDRLGPQAGSLAISANRHLDAYAALGAPWHAAIVTDAFADAITIASATASATAPATAPATASATAPATASATASTHYAGPLAGLLAGLQAARAAQLEWLVTAPCDSPWLPADLAARLTGEAVAQNADIATVTTTDSTGTVSLHPVFALVRVALADDLAAFLAAGERKVRAWYARHRTAEVDFADERAFYNINSLQQLAEFDRA